MFLKLVSSHVEDDYTDLLPGIVAVYIFQTHFDECVPIMYNREQYDSIREKMGSGISADAMVKAAQKVANVCECIKNYH